MTFRDCINQNKFILMEGALGERLKREYGLIFDEHIAMAGLVYEEKGASALTALWQEYIDIARENQLPFIATTPTRRANKERIAKANCPETVIADNVAFLKNIQRNCGIEMYVGGLMGCKGMPIQERVRLPSRKRSRFIVGRWNSFTKPVLISCMRELCRRSLRQRDWQEQLMKSDCRISSALRYNRTEN